MNTANKKLLKSFNVVIAAKTMVASPAAGPLTLKLEPLKKPTIIPPIIPEIKPENKGAPDARDIPKHKGRATKKTTRPAGKSFLKFLKNSCIKIVLSELNLNN